jgi:membrane protein implicated in regulation of membrane protease activity
MPDQIRFIANTRQSGPVGRFLLAVGAALLATVSLLLGFVFFVVILGFALVAGLILWFRLRSLQKRAPSGSGSGSDAIEGEYQVLSESRRREEWRP